MTSAYITTEPRSQVRPRASEVFVGGSGDRTQRHRAATVSPRYIPVRYHDASDGRPRRLGRPKYLRAARRALLLDVRRATRHAYPLRPPHAVAAHRHSPSTEHASSPSRKPLQVSASPHRCLRQARRCTCGPSRGSIEASRYIYVSRDSWLQWELIMYYIQSPTWSR